MGVLGMNIVPTFSIVTSVYLASHASLFDVGRHLAAIPNMQKNANAALDDRYTPEFPAHIVASIFPSSASSSHPDVHASDRYCQPGIIPFSLVLRMYGDRPYWKINATRTLYARSSTLLFRPDVALGGVDDDLSLPHHDPQSEAVAVQKQKVIPVRMDEMQPVIIPAMLVVWWWELAEHGNKNPLFLRD